MAGGGIGGRWFRRYKIPVRREISTRGIMYSVMTRVNTALWLVYVNVIKSLSQNIFFFLFFVSV